jgi:hypothetical protein
MRKKPSRFPSNLSFQVNRGSDDSDSDEKETVEEELLGQVVGQKEAR